MLFSPEKYKIQDEPLKPFIDADEIWNYINTTHSTEARVRVVIEKSLSKKRLSMEETAVLLNTTDETLLQEIKDAASTLKKEIYGNRIVLFAPLYIGNKCTNDCLYCGFRTTNEHIERLTLDLDAVRKNTEALQDQGHKRLILVFGEHPNYTPDFIAGIVETVYKVKKSQGEIRRVNINAAPLTQEGFNIVKKSGIGTYQIFQETYHRPTYEQYHISGNKSDYSNRLVSLDNAQEVGLDDVGIGVLFGLYDWRFEVLSLIRHTNHLEACYNVGPHTISFPRVNTAKNTNIKDTYFVNDADFEKLVAILRLAVPYTGLILTAREPEHIRSKVIEYGCSQIDGGTNINIGAYAGAAKSVPEVPNEQFSIHDNRSLQEVIQGLIANKHIPSFCTACYRLNRTGEHFMEFSIPGFIKRFCTPNAFFTFAEYLEDYGSPETKTKGYKLIEDELSQMEDQEQEALIRNKLSLIKQGKKDIFF